MKVLITGFDPFGGDRNGVIFTQFPVAILMLIAHIIVMYMFAF